jgi:ComF family protein
MRAPTITLAGYTPTTKNIVHTAKYDNVKEAAHTLSSEIIAAHAGALTALARYISQQKHPALFVPVPLTKAKQQTRGFNLSEIVATHIAAVLGWQTNNLLVKTKETTPQASLSSKQKRQANPHGAYEIKSTEAHKENVIIVVDDVLTTGATTDVCVQELKKYYKEVAVCCLLQEEHA